MYNVDDKVIDLLNCYWSRLLTLKYLKLLIHCALIFHHSFSTKWKYQFVHKNFQKKWIKCHRIFLECGSEHVFFRSKAEHRRRLAKDEILCRAEIFRAIAFPITATYAARSRSPRINKNFSPATAHAQASLLHSSTTDLEFVDQRKKKKIKTSIRNVKVNTFRRSKAFWYFFFILSVYNFTVSAPKKITDYSLEHHSKCKNTLSTKVRVKFQLQKIKIN